MGLGEARQAPRLRGQDRQDPDRPVQVRLGQEQVRQSREQEVVAQGQEVPVDRRLQCRQEGARRQGLLRHQEGLGSLQEGQGTLQEVNTAASLPRAQFEVAQAYPFPWTCTVEELVCATCTYLKHSASFKNH